VALLELRVDAVALLQLGRQTGGSGQVVSLGAVGDPDVHGGLLSEGLPRTLRAPGRARNPRPRADLDRFRWRRAPAGPTVLSIDRNLRDRFA
jgi:hypothetical protein